MANLAYIQITRQCNQACLFCSNPPSGKTELSLRSARNIIDRYKLAGYDGLVISGGEPTVYPYLQDLLSYIRSNDMQARIITNGQKISDPAFLRSLIESGLDHIFISLYSHRPRVQNYLSNNLRSWQNIKKSLILLKQSRIRTDMNITIHRLNSDHLQEMVEWVVDRFPQIRHFVFNNLDPSSVRARQHPELIPQFSRLAPELGRALSFLDSRGRTFRVERVPLCHMPGFEYASTETRKIVKNEVRPIYFLDNKRQKLQTSFFRTKPVICRQCGLDIICAGVYKPLGKLNYNSVHLAQNNAEEIRNKILRKYGE